MSSGAWSIRTRLFTGYAVALTVCCSLIAVIIYIGVRFLPTYRFSQTVVGEGDDATYVPGESVARPFEITTGESVWAVVLVISIAAVLIVLLLGLTVGWSLSRRMLAPLEFITVAAERVAAGDLSSRIDAHGPDDELQRLADTFDATMERLERSFDSHRRFAANASHELLTPLSTARGLLQLIPDADQEERTEIVRMLRDTNEGNIKLVNQLLELARAGHTNATAAEATDLTAAVEDVLGDLTPLTENANITVRSSLETKVTVQGDATLLRHLVRNLVQNAISHNVPGGWVQVTLSASSDNVELRIENTGAPIDLEIITHLHEPFYRIEARTHRAGHHGLGLALATAVAEAHNARLDVDARDGGGLMIGITIPTT
ncbi:sensor histidine kinase [Brachybacterium alimentarium]|uniref:sensor histidine kinase n=1 Tax=Brachybacterium alimentarium TaxID=47845 RepID=UPI003FD3E5BA